MLEENIKYIEDLKRFGTRLELEGMLELMGVLDEPQKKFKSIHVAGTNGKGSTGTMLASILKESGSKTGLYTSPYVEKFNERIQVNGEMISDEELEELIIELRKKVEENKLDVTFFEFVTCLAFLHFAKKGVDVAVIEVGLGGRLDATNVINPEISVITNIGLDHEKWLGNSKREIAKEKAGIIKRNQIVITAEDDKDLRDYFENVCRDKNSKFIYVNDLIKGNQIEDNLDYQKFLVSGLINGEFKIKLLGEHQIKNALLAIIVARELGLKEEFIKNGLEKASLKGRMEIVSRNPLIILDGAHNVDGMKSLRDFITRMKNRKTLILGIAEDKDIDGMAELIVPLFDNVIVTEGRFKPKSAEELAGEIRQYNENVIILKNVSDALKKARQLTKDSEMILVAGSLYLVSDVLGALSQ